MIVGLRSSKSFSVARALPFQYEVDGGFADVSLDGDTAIHGLVGTGEASSVVVNSQQTTRMRASAPDGLATPRVVLGHGVRIPWQTKRDANTLELFGPSRKASNWSSFKRRIQRPVII